MQSLISECYMAGEFCGRMILDNERLGFSMRRIHKADAAKARVDEIADIIGPDGEAAFSDGFNTILPPFDRREEIRDIA